MGTIAERLRALARANNTTIGPGDVNAELLALASEVERIAGVLHGERDGYDQATGYTLGDKRCRELASALAPAEARDA